MYVGYISSLPNAINSVSILKKTSFIMPYSISNACLSFAYTPGSTISLTQSSPFNNYARTNLAESDKVYYKLEDGDR